MKPFVAFLFLREKSKKEMSRYCWTPMLSKIHTWLSLFSQLFGLVGVAMFLGFSWFVNWCWRSLMFVFSWATHGFRSLRNNRRCNVSVQCLFPSTKCSARIHYIYAKSFVCSIRNILRTFVCEYLIFFRLLSHDNLKGISTMRIYHPKVTLQTTSTLQ